MNFEWIKKFKYMAILTNFLSDSALFGLGSYNDLFKCVNKWEIFPEKLPKKEVGFRSFPFSIQ